MKVRLECSENNKEKVSEILLSNNIIIDDFSSIVIVEDGFGIKSESSIKIVFDGRNLNDFTDFIQNFKPRKKIGDIIIGIDNGRYVPLKIENISYFSAANNDTFAHVSGCKKYLIKSKLYQLEDELQNKYFFRINKSELVNMKKISLITPMFKGRLLINLEGFKTPFDISRNYTKAFKERLGF